MITLECNYSKKIGLPQYSSHQFSVTLKTEIPGSAESGAASHNAQHGIKWEDIYGLIEEKCSARKLTKRELSQFLNKDIPTVNSVR